MSVEGEVRRCLWVSRVLSVRQNLIFFKNMSKIFLDNNSDLLRTEPRVGDFYRRYIRNTVTTNKKSLEGKGLLFASFPRGFFFILGEISEVPHNNRHFFFWVIWVLPRIWSDQVAKVLQVGRRANNCWRSGWCSSFYTCESSRLKACRNAVTGRPWEFKTNLKLFLPPVDVQS